MNIIRGGIMRSQPALDLSQAIYPRTMHGNIGFRIIGGGNIGFDNTTATTFRAMIEIAAPSYEAVQPIFCNMRPENGYTVAGCNVRPASNFTAPVGTPTTVTLPGGGVIAAAPALNEKVFMLGDWVEIPSVPRDDGGTGAIVIFDAYITTAGTIGLASVGNINILAARERHAHVFRKNNGDCVTTPANFTSTNNRGYSPIVGVRYLFAGRIVTVMGIGDSVTYGEDNDAAIGFLLPACEKASDLSNITFECAMLALGAQQSPLFSTFLDSAISAGLIPDILFRPAGSANDLGSGPIISSQIATTRRWLAKNLKSCSEYSIAPLLWTMLPMNSRGWDASDSLRRDYNAEMLGMKGASVIDLAAVVSGPIDVDGQVKFIPATTTDLTHPNEYGNSLLANSVAERLLKVQ